MYVKVYFERSAHAEMVAIFRDEEMYTEALGGLEAEAEKNGMTVTDSMVEDAGEVLLLDRLFNGSSKQSFSIEDVEFDVQVFADDIPVRGNAIASGDDAEDKEVEDAIIEKLNSGDVWAWCIVEVSGTYRGLSASTSLSGCSYANLQEFKDGGAYDDMCTEVYNDLVSQLADLIS